MADVLDSMVLIAGSLPLVISRDRAVPQKCNKRKRKLVDLQLVSFISAALIREERSKIEEFVESVVPKYLPDQFKMFFRVSRETFECLLVNLTEVHILKRREHSGGRQETTLEKDLLMMLWYLGSQETIRSISDRFDVQESTFIAHNRRLLDVFCNMCKKFVAWPNDAEKPQIMSAFQDVRRFPGILGAIDGTHISIKPPGANEADYVNRKSYHSIILQAVCKHDRVFTNIDCGWPGRVNDARVFRNSDVGRFLSSLCGENHLIGDGAYPLSRFLMKPYRESANLTRAEKIFNQKLCSTRTVIEHAFGMLKARFRRLQHINMNDIEYIVKAAVTTCVLHNICILNQDDLNEHFEIEVDDVVGVEMPADTAEGNLKRMLLTRQLSHA